MEEFESSIKRLREDIIHYDTVLNESGTWLFLATLACWSVPEGIPRKFAISAVFVIFSHQVISQLRSKTPFKQRIKELASEIDKKIECEVQRDALKYRLFEVKKTYLSNWRLLFKVPAYVASGVFILISIMSWMGKL